MLPKCRSEGDLLSIPKFTIEEDNVEGFIDDCVSWNKPASFWGSKKRYTPFITCNCRGFINQVGAKQLAVNSGG